MYLDFPKRLVLQFNLNIFVKNTEGIMLDIFSLASSVVLGLSLIFNLISLGTVFWAKLSTFEVYLNIGLWQVCGGTKRFEICQDNIGSRLGKLMKMII